LLRKARAASVATVSRTTIRSTARPAANSRAAAASPKRCTLEAIRSSVRSPAQDAWPSCRISMAVCTSDLKEGGIAAVLLEARCSETAEGRRPGHSAGGMPGARRWPGAQGTDNSLGFGVVVLGARLVPRSPSEFEVPHAFGNRAIAALAKLSDVHRNCPAGLCAGRGLGPNCRWVHGWRRGTFFPAKGTRFLLRKTVEAPKSAASQSGRKT
jgi:hypothetical protein